MVPIIFEKPTNADYRTFEPIVEKFSLADLENLKYLKSCTYKDIMCLSIRYIDIILP